MAPGQPLDRLSPAPRHSLDLALEGHVDESRDAPAPGSFRRVSVHSVLPPALTSAVDEVLRAPTVRHMAHGDADPVEACAAAASDESAMAVIGPYRSADVAEAVVATAPLGLPLLAPVATWAGVTRDDEPGCEDPARHRGTVLRMVARDTVVAGRIAATIRAAGQRAHVVAGEHEYGRQLDEQLSLGGLPRADDGAEADVVVLAGLATGPEIGEVADLSPLPVIAFDGVQGADLRTAGEIRLALPMAPQPAIGVDALLGGVERARRAAELVVSALAAGARDRVALLRELRAQGGFDYHGDPVDPPVWLWRVRDDWEVEPDRAI